MSGEAYEPPEVRVLAGGELERAKRLLSGQFSIDEFKQVMGSLSECLREIVAHPEIVETWEPAQQAWFLEHLEMLLQDSHDLQVKIEDHIGG